MVHPSITQSNGRKSKRGDFNKKTEIFYFEKEYHFPDHFRRRSFNPLFHSGIYHVTCIWPVSKSSSYSPLTLYLACSIFRLLSANLSLSFSPSHQVTLDSGVWQPHCRCSPVRACLKQDFKTNSEELKNHTNVERYNTERLHRHTLHSHLAGLNEQFS